MAFATTAKVSLANGISYRQQPTWQAATRLFVTQKGFPWGRSVFPATSSTSDPSAATPGSASEFADPSRFAGLAVIYAQLMNGDLIKRQMHARFRHGVF